MRRLFLATLAGGVCILAPPPSFAGPLGPPLTDKELDGMRGGFQAGGVEMNLGAVVRTLVDGELSLQSTISWTSQGPIVTRWTGGDIAPADADALHNAAVDRGLDLAGFDEGDVFLLAGGGAAVIHRIDDRSLQNILLNVENNLNIRQEIDVTLTLPGFEATQRSIIGGLMGMQVGRDLGAAGVTALGG